MKNKIYIVFLLSVLISACTFYSPGFDFKLFNYTRAKELADAVEDEDLEQIEEIVKTQKVNIDYQEPKFGNTVLMLAVANNKNKAARKLLELGANPNAQSDMNGETALTILTYDFYNDSCNTELLTDLLKFGANPNIGKLINNNDPEPPALRTPLMCAAATGKCLEIVKILVENGADINYSFEKDNGSMVVIWSVLETDLEIAKYLIVEKKAKLPRSIWGFRKDTLNQRMLTVTDYLNEKDYDKNKRLKGSKNIRLKQEILEYLKANGLK